jgi:hypothetical protein
MMAPGASLWKGQGCQTVAPGVRVHEAAGNVGQDLTSVTVISVADDSGTSGETGVLQVVEEGVDGRGPWSGRTQHGVAVPQDWGGLAFGPGQQLEVIGWRHRQHAAMPPPWHATRL